MTIRLTHLARAAAAALGTLAAAAAGAQTGQPPAVGQLIIEFDSATAEQAASTSLSQLAAQHQVQLKGLHKLAVGGQVFKMDRQLSDAQARTLAKAIARLPGVKLAEPDLMLQPLAAPNDTLWANQWHYWDAAAGINLEQAWAQGAQGEGVVVGVLDTGYRPHVDLVANILPGYDFLTDADRARDGDGRDPDATDEGDWTRLFGVIPIDSSWHGTHVAGTVAAVTNNGEGVAGVAPRAKVMPVRVLAKDGGTISDIVDAIVWSAGGNVEGMKRTKTPARVINMSLGGSGACSEPLQRAINAATRRGALVVVAAGNSSADASGHNPANCRNVLTIAATGPTGGRASYSNFGATIELAAPGGDEGAPVWSTSNTGKKLPEADSYAGGSYYGTSMAAPHVAGVAALMLSKNPTLTPRQMGKILVKTARPFPAPCDQCGSGLLDANAALAKTPEAPSH